jgi:hypothetical protein
LLRRGRALIRARGTPRSGVDVIVVIDGDGDGDVAAQRHSLVNMAITRHAFQSLKQ